MKDDARSSGVPLGRLVAQTREPSRDRLYRWFVVAVCWLLCGSGVKMLADTAHTAWVRDWFSTAIRPIDVLKEWTRMVTTSGLGSRREKARTYAIFKFQDAAPDGPRFVMSNYTDEPKWLVAGGTLSGAETQFKPLQVYMPCRFHPGFSAALNVMISSALSLVMLVVAVHFTKNRLT